MALFKKHKTEPVPPEDTGAHDTSVGTAADVEAVMKKYDRESNTRVWEGLPKLVIRWLMVAFSAYCIIDTVFLSTRQEVRLPMFVGLILLFGFLTFPAKKGDERVNHMPWYDIVLLIAGPGAYFFYAVNAQNVVQMSARVMQNDPVHDYRPHRYPGPGGAVPAGAWACRSCAWPVCCWCTPSSTWAAVQISR